MKVASKSILSRHFILFFVVDHLKSELWVIGAQSQGKENSDIYEMVVLESTQSLSQ